MGEIGVTVESLEGGSFIIPSPVTNAMLAALPIHTVDDCDATVER